MELTSARGRLRAALAGPSVGFTHGDALRMAASDAPLRTALGALEQAGVDLRISVAFA